MDDRDGTGTAPSPPDGAPPAGPAGPAPDADSAGSDTLTERIDRLHHDTFAGTALGHHTDLWNLVHAFKERVKAMVRDAAGSRQAASPDSP